MTNELDLSNIVTCRDALVEQDYPTAINAVSVFLQDKPDHPYGIIFLAITSFLMDNKVQALNLLERLHTADPDHRETVDTLAVILAYSGNINDSLYYAKLATVLEPDKTLEALIPYFFRDYSSALENTSDHTLHLQASIHFDKGNYAECAHVCKNEIKVDPTDWDSYFLLGRAMKNLHSYDDALTSFHSAIAGSQSNDPVWLIEIAECWRALGRKEDALVCYTQALTNSHQNPNLLARSLEGMSRLQALSSLEAKMAIEQLTSLILKDAEEAILMSGGEGIKERKIRVAYLSDAFYDCEKGAIIETVLNGHDKNKFEIFCYQQNTNTDLSTTHMKNVVNDWREIHELDDLTASYLMTCDGIDVLIDCIGVSQNQRLNVIAQHPAPVVLSWLNTVSAQACFDVNKNLTSACFEHGGANFDQDSLLLAMDMNPIPEQDQDRALTLGVYCDLSLLDQQTILTWTEILKRNKAANLLIGGPGSDQRAVRARYSEIFMSFGVANRLFFMNTSTQSHPFSALIENSDFILSPLAHADAKVTIAALAAGTPVIALDHETDIAPLSGHHILKASKKTQWLAKTAPEYIQIAEALSKSAPTLNKKELSKELSNSPIFHPKTLAQDMENIISSTLKDQDLL